MRYETINAYIRRLSGICAVLLCLAAIAGCQDVDNIQRPVWHDLRVGESTTSDVVETLGEPFKVRQEGEFLVYSYPSSPSGMSAPNRMIFQNDVLTMVMERNIDGTKLDAVLSTYGDPDEVTWPFPVTCNTRLFIFARHGMAVDAEILVSPKYSYVLQKWYFLPTALEEFRKEFAPIFLPGSSSCSDDQYPSDYWIREPP
jgi:hypothetical protein